MALPSFPTGLLRRSMWPPPGQRALHVQRFPAARAVGRNCTRGGPGTPLTCRASGLSCGRP
eukprot:251155-Alexandrium_andersonii.AAC.1